MAGTRTYQCGIHRSGLGTYTNADGIFISIDLELTQHDVNVKYHHLNLLTDELPFEDGYFDYVHVRGIAAGIPENCWLGDHKTASGVFDKALRVLRVGGYFEVMERTARLPPMLIL